MYFCIRTTYWFGKSLQVSFSKISINSNTVDSLRFQLCHSFMVKFGNKNFSPLSIIKVDLVCHHKELFKMFVEILKSVLINSKKKKKTVG